MNLSNHANFRFGRSVLVIPDAHARPGERLDEFDRFNAAGKLILELKPDVVLCIGDLGDFNSLNPYREKAAAAFDGKELKADVGAMKAALKDLMGPTINANRKHNRNRRNDRQWMPKLVFCEGNHEERWRRYDETKFEGHDYIEQIVEKEGWSWVPFLETADIEGVLFSHYFPTGVSRKPAGIGQILSKTHRSCVYGHTHSWGHVQQPVMDRGTISALCAGCFKPPQRTGEHEWSGLTLLTDVKDGAFCIQQFSYDSVLERFGDGAYAQELRAERASRAIDLRYASLTYGSHVA